MTLASYVLDLVPPGQQLHYERQNQLDMGFQAVPLRPLRAVGAGRHLQHRELVLREEQNITWGPSLGQPLDILQPRTLRLAAQFRF